MTNKKCINCLRTLYSFDKKNLVDNKNLNLCARCYYKTMISYESVYKIFKVPESILLQLNIKRIRDPYYRYYINDIQEHIIAIDYVKNYDHVIEILNRYLDIVDNIKSLIEKTATDLQLKNTYLNKLGINNIILKYSKDEIDTFTPANLIYMEYIAPDLKKKRLHSEKKNVVDGMLKNISNNYTYIFDSEYYKKLIEPLHYETILHKTTFASTIKKIKRDEKYIKDLILTNIKESLLPMIKKNIKCDDYVCYRYLNKLRLSDIINNDIIIYDEKKISTQIRYIHVFHVINDYKTNLRCKDKKFICDNILYNVFFDSDVQKYIHENIIINCHFSINWKLWIRGDFLYDYEGNISKLILHKIQSKSKVKYTNYNFYNTDVLTNKFYSKYYFLLSGDNILFSMLVNKDSDIQSIKDREQYLIDYYNANYYFL